MVEIGLVYRLARQHQTMDLPTIYTWIHCTAQHNLPQVVPFTKDYGGPMDGCVSAVILHRAAKSGLVVEVKLWEAKQIGHHRCRRV